MSEALRGAGDEIFFGDNTDKTEFSLHLLPLPPAVKKLCFNNVMPICHPAQALVENHCLMVINFL